MIEYIIYALVFISVCVNPAMAGHYLKGYDFNDKRRLLHAKCLQVFNGVVSVALLILLTILFDNLVEGYIINW